MHLRRILEESCSPCLRQYDSVITRIGDFKPGDWIDWVQLVTSVIGILWILYQFNRLRRNAEKELEEYLERHLEQKIKDFQKERAKALPIFDELENRSRISKIFAFLERVVFAILKWFPLVPQISEQQRAFAMLKSGSYQGAKCCFEEYGNELLELATKYEGQASIKRHEAANVFLYAGCVAASSKDEATSISAFKKVLDVDKADVDAHERIGLEYLRIDSLGAALAEFHAMKDAAAEDRARKAKAFRLSARVHKRQSKPGLAWKELQQALDIETERKDHAKIGETLEMLGDLYRDRHPRFQNAALQYYDRAIENYKIASDFSSVSKVERTIWGLTHKQKFLETFASRILNRTAEILKTIALKLRAPDHTQ